MKTVITITRSIITSLLFVVIMTSVAAQLVFTAIKTTSSDIEKMIDRELLLNSLAPSIENTTEREVAIAYIDDYLKYVFHKKSYPSLQTVDFQDLTEEERKETERMLLSIKENIDVEYELVLKMRDANNFLSNGAVYLLLNIGIFLFFILAAIAMFSFKKGAKLFGLAMTTGAFVVFTGGLIIKNNIAKILEGNVYNIAFGIDNDSVFQRLSNLALVYILLGFVLFASIYILEHIQSKKQIEEN